jgi:D-alanyl-D-alanine dipeptidase
MYPAAEAWLRKPAAKALKMVQKELKSQGLGLLVFDAYRPYSVTLAFYRATDKKEFVAHPKDGSRHNRGCAVDVTLVDLKTGLPLAMPTDFDDFSEKASPTYSHLSEEVLRNRAILISAMRRYGFKVFYNEWWHFDFEGWEDYDLMDLSFEELAKQ